MEETISNHKATHFCKKTEAFQQQTVEFLLYAVTYQTDNTDYFDKTDKNRQKPSKTDLSSKTDEIDENRQKPTLRTSFSSVFLKARMPQMFNSNLIIRTSLPMNFEMYNQFNR